MMMNELKESQRVALSTLPTLPALPALPTLSALPAQPLSLLTINIIHGSILSNIYKRIR